MNLTDAVCVITGGAKGIGLAMAETILGKGARVAICDVDQEALNSCEGRFPDSSKVLCLPVDIRRPGELEEFARLIVKKWGRMDVWINNAGLARHRPIVDYTEEDIDLMMDVNLKGAVLGCQTALRVMIPQGRGHIINVISTASLRGIPTESFYCATKWGLRGFTQALQEEAAPHGIRATAILPGGVDTEFWDSAVDRQMPVGDFLRPEDIANTTVSVLEQDDHCVVREVVVRSIRDRDFAE